MKIEVEMHAFADGAIRTVTLPGDAEPTLGRVFELGQNDFCTDEDRAQGLPSVSVGDIIRFEGKRHVVAPVGFAEVPADFEPPHGDGGFYAYDLAKWLVPVKEG
jgi:hypothetical protein